MAAADGGIIVAQLNVPADGSEATVEGLTLPPLDLTEQALADRLDVALGTPQRVLGSAAFERRPVPASASQRRTNRRRVAHYALDDSGRRRRRERSGEAEAPRHHG